MRVDRVAREQELQRALAADRARDRHHRRRAEEPDLDARRREPRLLGGDDEIARRDELAARPRSPSRAPSRSPAAGRGGSSPSSPCRRRTAARRRRRRGRPSRPGRARPRTRGRRPAITIARTSRSPPTSSSAAISSSISSSESAFRFSGRLSVIVAAGPSRVDEQVPEGGVACRQRHDHPRVRHRSAGPPLAADAARVPRALCGRVPGRGRGRRRRAAADLGRAARARRAGSPSALQEAGIEKGDRVAYLALNTTELLEAHFGVPGRGRACSSPINTRLLADEVEYILDHSGARLLVVDPSLAHARGRGRAGRAGARRSARSYEAFLAGAP